MQDKKLLYILAAVAFVALGAIGWALVRRSAKNSTNPSTTIPAITRAEEATKETNKTVLDETKTSSGQILKAVSGKVIGLDGQKLVLETDGDRVQILVAADAQITRTTFLADRTVPPQTEVIALADVKVGDRVDALVKTEGGTTMASSVNVVVAP